MDLYTDELRALVHHAKFPKGLLVEVVEYSDHVALRLYRHNFETFDGECKRAIADQLQDTFNRARELGCAFFLEVQ